MKRVEWRLRISCEKPACCDSPAGGRNEEPHGSFFWPHHFGTVRIFAWRCCSAICFHKRRKSHESMARSMAWGKHHSHSERLHHHTLVRPSAGTVWATCPGALEDRQKLTRAFVLGQRRRCATPHLSRSFLDRRPVQYQVLLLQVVYDRCCVQLRPETEQGGRVQVSCPARIRVRHEWPGRVARCPRSSLVQHVVAELGS